REIAGHQKFGDEQKHHARSGQSGQGGETQSSQRPDMAQMDQEVSRPAEPGQENSQAHGIDERKVRSLCPLPAAMMGSAMTATMTAADVSAQVKVAVGQVKVKMQRAAQKRERGKSKAYDETDQIKEFPVHSFTSLKSGLAYLGRTILLLRTQHV